jgi:hypothetical protein
MSELKVLISDNFAFASDAVAVAIILQHNHDERSVMHVSPEGYTTWDNVDPLVANKPTFTLPNDAARALLDGLMRHYQGASDMHTVRRDLLHERGRVDKMLEAVTALAGKAMDTADAAISA